MNFFLKPGKVRTGIIAAFLLSLVSCLSAVAQGPSLDNPDNMPRPYDPLGGCALPLPSRFAKTLQDAPDGPVIIRATVVRVISDSERSGRGPTDQSEAARWAVVSVDEVIKGEVQERVLSVNIGGGCVERFRVGQSGYLAGVLITEKIVNPLVPGTRAFVIKIR